MKDFLKVTAAVVCGFLIVTVIMLMLGFGFLGALLAAGSSAPVLPKSGVLRIDMSEFTLAEQSREAGAFSAIGGGPSNSTIGIWDAVQAVNAAAVNQFALLSRRISSMATLAKIAPLLGLMGTVLGFLEIFSAISDKGSFISVSELSLGIYKALISTAFGLFVAIAGWIAYSYLNSRLKVLSQDIDWAANEMMLFIVRKMPEKEDLYIEGKEKKQ